MVVLVTGATGFVGGHVVRRLVEDGVSVRGLVRRGTDPAGLERAGAAVAPGDVTDPSSLARAMDRVDAIVHLVGVIREIPKRGITYERIHVEGTRNLLAAAKTAGVTRFVYVSGIGARADPGATAFHRSKYAAEQLARARGIGHVIFRPSTLIGRDGEFTKLLIDLVSRPIVPVIGSGDMPMQPMYVGDLAAYVSKALLSDALNDQTFDVAGPDVMTFNEMLRRTASAIGAKARLVHIPLGLIRAAVPIMERILPNPPITRAELQMLLEGSVAGETRIRDLAPIELRPLEHGLSPHNT
jgi:uncharacterized protein YbjT (DUF2867 family)